jgi:hypothetical protein
MDLGEKYSNHDQLMKYHSKLVAEILDSIVKNLEHLDDETSRLIQIGRQHACLSQWGLKPKFWDVLAEAFIECTLEWGEKNRRIEEARKAWVIIVTFVTEKMKYGFQDERRQRPRNFTLP